MTLNGLMKHFIIIRGPAASGKSTIARRLASILKAYYVSFDDIMRDNRLDTVIRGGIPANNFIKANDIVLKKIKGKEKVIFDGCFYRKKQIDDLIVKLPVKYKIITLNASVSECIRRNKGRKEAISEKDVKQVYNLVSRLKVGKQIRTDAKTEDETIAEVIRHLRNL